MLHISIDMRDILATECLALQEFVDHPLNLGHMKVAGQLRGGIKRQWI